MPQDEIQRVRRFWSLFSEQKWDEAQALLADDFVAEWPQSRERMRGSEAFIAVNRHYPGNHRIEVVHADSLGPGRVVTTVWITADTGQKTFAISYFGLSGDKLSRVEEYWAEPYAAPEWRRRWVELY